MSHSTQIQVDYLIVGQGLAGTLLAHFLSEAGQRVHVIDDNYPRAASKVAAGIINPVTGRRYVKSWRIESLIPKARDTYRQLEKQLGIEIYHPRNVLRALFNNREVNDWQARTYEPGYQQYMLPRDAVDIGRYRELTHVAFDYGELREGAQVEIGTLVQRYRQFLSDQNQLSEEAFDFTQLQLVDKQVRYRGIQAGGLIFCEGAKARANPYFSYLPYEGNKGEALITDIPEAHFRKILKQQIFVVPLADGHYWIGSTSDNFHTDDLPTAQGRQYLTDKLRNLLRAPFQLLEHRAAIRPTVKDRRPLIGRHPEFPQLIIFNGLGTKGASLGPYWAQHLVDVLLAGEAPDPEADIARFQKLF